MPESGLFGPHSLSGEVIDRAVKGVGPGTYVLGHTLDNGNFRINYVGRADRDLNDRLKDHAGKYHEFKFGFFQSAADAFYRECRIFHDFGPRDNLIHPDAPTGSNLRCPHCPPT